MQFEMTVLTEAVYILLASNPDTMYRVLLKTKIFSGGTATPSIAIV